MKLLIAATVVAFLVIVGYRTVTTKDPATAAPKPITISIGQTVRDFISQNDLKIGARGKHDFSVDAQKFEDTSPIIYDDHWLSVRYADGPYSVNLPAGRTLIVSQIAGRVTGFAANLFDQPLPLDEMRRRVRGLIADLVAKGWSSKGDITIPESPTDLDRLTGRKIIAQLDAASFGRPGLDVTISDLGQVPKAESYILSFNPFSKPAAPSGRYVVQISIRGTAVDDLDYRQAVYPRRIFVNGDKNAALPLQAWIDDPDWTPQKAGMVEATPEQRAKPDSPFWVMPAKDRP